METVGNWKTTRQVSNLVSFDVLPLYVARPTLTQAHPVTAIAILVQSSEHTFGQCLAPMYTGSFPVQSGIFGVFICEIGAFWLCLWLVCLLYNRTA